MNYYNPYFTLYPYTNMVRPSLFSRLATGIKGINFSSILSGTGKALNVVNQTIPIVKQVKPVFKNAKTMFKVMNEFKRVNTPTINKKNSSNNKSIINEEIPIKYDNGPVFFQ